MAEQAERATIAQRAAGPVGYGLDLQINELVLYGFRPSDRYAIAAAVEQELGRLFTEQGVPPGLAAGQAGRGEDETTGEARSVFRVDAGSFEAPHNATPDVVGIELARAIHRSLGGMSAGGQEPGAGSR